MSERVETSGSGRGVRRATGSWMMMLAGALAGVAAPTRIAAADGATGPNAPIPGQLAKARVADEDLSRPDRSGDDVLAAAILDRLLRHSHTLMIQGESFRLKQKRRAGVVPAKVQ